MSTYSYFVRGAYHANLCRTSMESVRKVDPLAKFIVMTDETPGERGWVFDAAIYYIPPGMPIMLANLEAQVSTMFVADPHEPVIFIDTDILLLKPLHAHADLTITWRDHVLTDGDEKIEGVASYMPYNYGVIVAQNRGVTIEALIWLRERIRKMHDRHQKWYGNQLALAELAGPRPDSGTSIDVRAIPWMLTNHGNTLRIAKVPCETYNYTPQRDGEDIESRAVLHFKGKSRHLMESYAKRLGLGWYVEAKAA